MSVFSFHVPPFMVN